MSEQSIGRRLARSAEAVRAYRDSYEAELERRDAIIIEAIELGLTWKEVAKIVGVGPGRISQVILRRSTQVPEPAA